MINKDKETPNFDGFTEEQIINRIIYWYTRRDELKNLAYYINYGDTDISFKKEKVLIKFFNKRIMHRAKEFKLTEGEQTYFYSWCIEYIEYLDFLIENSPKHERSIAELVYEGKISKEQAIRL